MNQRIPYLSLHHNDKLTSMMYECDFKINWEKEKL